MFFKSTHSAWRLHSWSNLFSFYNHLNYFVIELNAQKLYAVFSRQFFLYMIGSKIYIQFNMKVNYVYCWKKLPLHGPCSSWLSCCMISFLNKLEYKPSILSTNDYKDWGLYVLQLITWYKGLYSFPRQQNHYDII